MTVITVTTVGYREVHPLSRPGEVFTVVLLIGGVGTVFYALTLFVARVVEGGCAARWEALRRERMIDELANTSSSAVTAASAASSSTSSGSRTCRTSSSIATPTSCTRSSAGSLAVAADASAEETLQRIGIAAPARVIAAVGTDAENVYIILSARLMRPDLFIIGRAESEDTRAPACSAPAPTASSRRTRSAPTRSRRPRCGRRSSISCSSPRAREAARARRSNRFASNLPAVSPDGHVADRQRCGSGSASSSLHPAGGRPHGVQPAAGSRHANGRSDRRVGQARTLQQLSRARAEAAGRWSAHMPPRLLDGTALAAQIREELGRASRRPRAHGRRPASGSCSSATIRRRRLRAQQGEGRRRSRHRSSTSSACPRPPRSTRCSATYGASTRATDARRHPRAVAAAGRSGRRRDASSSTRSRREGRRRVQPDQRRQPRPEAAPSCPCTPAGVIELLRSLGIPIAGRARGRHRPQRHRRQADGA